MIRYQASITDCKMCSQRTKCCSGNTRCGRSIVVTKENTVVTTFRARTASAEGQAALRQRSVVAEFANAWLKEKLGLRRFRVRGLAKIRTEVLWAALTYNVQQSSDSVATATLRKRITFVPVPQWPGCEI